MKSTLVITIIAPPTRAMQEFAQGCQKRSLEFIVLGDSVAPPNFALDGCDHYPIERHLQTRLRYANAAPQRPYARKKIGYLVSIEKGAYLIIESGDDNYSLPSF